MPWLIVSPYVNDYKRRPTNWGIQTYFFKDENELLRDKIC